MENMQIMLIKREHDQQTLASIKALPLEIQEELADYVLSAEQFIHMINVANNMTLMGMNGKSVVSQEFTEMAEDVMDCITSGLYFVVA